jgi:uncharacterized repeat protein (TIGR01451 family)
MNLSRLLAITLLVGVTIAGFAANALALTAACSSITNQATLSYDIGGGTVTLDSDDPSTVAAGDATAFTVDTKVDLTVSNPGGPKLSASGSSQLLVFNIENTGNDTQRYTLRLYAGNNTQTYLAATDMFNMSNVRVYYDTTPDGTFDVADAANLLATDPANGADLGITPDVAGDVGGVNSIDIYVVADVPGGTNNGYDAIYTLKALTYQTAANASAPGPVLGGETTSLSYNVSCTGNETVLADVAAAGGVGTGVGDAANDGDHYATSYYEVANAAISVSKSQDPLWDPVNGNSTPRAIPGAYVQYVITVTNGGTAPATLQTITDALQTPDVAIDPDLIDGTSAAPTPGVPEDTPNTGNGFKVVVSGSTRAAEGTDQFFTTANDSDGVDENAGTVTADFAVILAAEGAYGDGELGPGESVTLTFNVIIQ